jgi:hypothetical protein
MGYRTDLTMVLSSDVYLSFINAVNNSEDRFDELRNILSNQNHNPRQTIAYERMFNGTPQVVFVVQDVNNDSVNQLNELFGQAGIDDENYSIISLSESDADIVEYAGNDATEFGISYSVDLDEHRDVIRNVYNSLPEQTQEQVVQDIIMNFYDDDLIHAKALVKATLDRNEVDQFTILSGLAGTDRRRKYILTEDILSKSINLNEAILSKEKVIEIAADQDELEDLDSDYGPR